MRSGDAERIDGHGEQIISDRAHICTDMQNRKGNDRRDFTQRLSRQIDIEATAHSFGQQRLVNLHNLCACCHERGGLARQDVCQAQKKLRVVAAPVGHARREACRKGQRHRPGQNAFDSGPSTCEQPCQQVIAGNKRLLRHRWRCFELPGVIRTLPKTRYTSGKEADDVGANLAVANQINSSSNLVFHRALNGALGR